MADDLETANNRIDQLVTELAASSSSFKNLTTTHTALVEQHETAKSSLTTREAELKQLTDSSKASTKSLEELQIQITTKDTEIATHVASLETFEALKTSHNELQTTMLVSQKDRLKAAGIGDELLVDKDAVALTAMEATVAAIKAHTPNGTVANPTGNGLAGGGAGQIPAPPVGLEVEMAEVKKAKERAGIKTS